MNLQLVSRLAALLLPWLTENLVQGWVSRPAENLIADPQLVGLSLTQDKLLQLKPGEGEEKRQELQTFQQTRNGYTSSEPHVDPDLIER